MANERILVVEDESIVAKNIQSRLKKLGYNVLALVSSGEEAIRRAEQTQPDLVLMDIVLKGDIDGVEAAKEIRARLNIPIIFLTAYADDNTLERAKIAEPFGYLLKPFEIRELRSVIEIAIYKHKMERRLRKREWWLDVTLKSIGDGVIAADAEGLVAFMNPVAERMTGWRREDALGKDLKEVFHIINAETRAAEDLLTRTLDKNGIVELVNYALISKNGIQIPIDASAVPIQNGRGGITGVVLVFRALTKYGQPGVEISNQRPESIDKMGNIPISLIVATRSIFIQDGVRKMLEAEKDIEIVAEASDYPEIISSVEQKRPDVLFIDTALSDLDVVKILETMEEKNTRTKALLLLRALDERFIINAISLGARGCLTGSSNAEQFIQAIRTVSKDEIWADIKVITKILTRLLPSKKGKSALNPNLTKREEEIIRLVVQGWSNKQISKELFITESTVKTHLVNIFRKLGINNRLQLAMDFINQDISKSVSRL
jgi:PAS domain S-box-containing protein